MNDRRTQGALLLAVAGIAVRLGVTDASLAYVKAGLRPLLVASGVVLAILGGAALLGALRASDPGAGELAADGGGGHGGHSEHESHGPSVAWLLVLPLLALLLIAPPPLGAFAAGRQSTRPPTSNISNYPPLPDPVDGAVPLRMSEFVFRALYDKDRSLDGERVRLSGFVSDAEAGEGYLLSRFMLNCCAADARAISVEIIGDEIPRTADTWLEIEGVWQPRPGVNPGEPTVDPPLLVADTVRVMPAPNQPYEY